MDLCSVPLPCSNKLPKRQGAKKKVGEGAVAVAVAVLAVATAAPAAPSTSGGLGGVTSASVCFAASAAPEHRGPGGGKD